MTKTGKTTQPIPVLYRSILQARYRPELTFYNLFYQAAQHYIDRGYPHWQTDRFKVTVFDPSKHCSLGIAHDSFNYTQDSHDLVQEQEQVAEIIKHLPEALHVNHFTRFGLRRWYLVPIEIPFNSLVSILSVKLFAQDKRLTKIFSDQFEDVAHTTVTATGPYKCRTHIGPLRQIDVPSYLIYDKDYHLEPGKKEEEYIEIKKAYPDVCLYIDIDFFQVKDDLTKLTRRDLSEFIDRANEHVGRFVDDLANYIFATEVKN